MPSCARGTLIALGIVLNILVVIVGVYSIFEFVYDRMVYVSVIGKTKYVIEGKERIGSRGIIGIEDKVDVTDDKGAFKIERVKAEDQKMFTFTLYEDGRYIRSQKRLDVKRKSFWNPNVNMGEIFLEPSQAAIIEKPKVKLNGKITYMELDKRKKGVPDGTIYIAKKDMLRRTDSEGNYSIEFPPGEYCLLIVGPDKRSFHEYDISDISKDDRKNIENFPRNFGAVRGLVKEKDGKTPAKGVFVNIDNKYFQITDGKGEYFIDNIPFNQKGERYSFVARRGLHETPYMSDIRIESYEVAKKDIPSFPPKFVVAMQIKELVGIGAVPVGISSIYPIKADKIFAWTDTSDIPGEKVIHTWYFENKEVNTMSMEISSPFKAYSETKILPSQKGAWRVEALTEDGKIIDSLQFKVK